jgi:hypothetical protein
MEFIDIIEGKATDIIEIMLHLRDLSLTIHPDIIEDCYGGKAVQMALYSIHKKDNVTHGISASKDHCKIFLHHFDKVDTSKFKLEGKGKHSRHIKIFEVQDIDKNSLLKVLKEIAIIVNSKH